MKKYTQSLKKRIIPLYHAMIFLSICGIIYMMTPDLARGQGLTDGFFRGAGHWDATVAATFESADEFYNGKQKVDIPPFYKKLSKTTLSLFIAYGITDNVDVSLNLPYIFANGDADGPPDQIPPQDFNDIQDAQLTAKWRPLRTVVGPGSFNLAIAGALTVPLSDYQNGEFPDNVSQKPILVAIGDRTTRVSGSLVAQYEFNSGLFTNVEGGYTISGNTGDNDLDVPNAAFVSGKLGYAARLYYAALFAAGQFSTEGTDIGEGPFPTNKVNYSRLGATASVRIIPGLNANVAYFITVDGRNASKSNGVSVGLTLKPRAF